MHPYNGHLGIVQALLRAGANLDLRNKVRVLFEADWRKIVMFTVAGRVACNYFGSGWIAKRCT